LLALLLDKLLMPRPRFQRGKTAGGVDLSQLGELMARYLLNLRTGLL